MIDSILIDIYIYADLAIISNQGAGWLGEARVSCILRHLGVQLILAYSWARPAILVAGKESRGNFSVSSVSSLSFIFFSPLSLSFISSTISSISCLLFSWRGHKMTHKG